MTHRPRWFFRTQNWKENIFFILLKISTCLTGGCCWAPSFLGLCGPAVSCGLLEGSTRTMIAMVVYEKYPSNEKGTVLYKKKFKKIWGEKLANKLLICWLKKRMLNPLFPNEYPRTQTSSEFYVFFCSPLWRFVFFCFVFSLYRKSPLKKCWWYVLVINPRALLNAFLNYFLTSKTLDFIHKFSLSIDLFLTFMFSHLKNIYFQLQIFKKNFFFYFIQKIWGEENNTLSYKRSQHICYFHKKYRFLF